MLDALFDHVVVNSALLTQPRWWLRPFPKLAWKLYAVTGTAFYAWLLVKSGNMIPLLLTPPGLIVYWLYMVTFRSIVRGVVGKRVLERQRAVVAAIRAELGRLPGVSDVEIVYPTRNHKGDPNKSEMRIRFVLAREATTNGDAAIRTLTRELWRSRLYPLHTIVVDWIRGYSSLPETKLTWNRAERRRLRDEYGPRPYGWLPRWY